MQKRSDPPSHHSWRRAPLPDQPTKTLDQCDPMLQPHDDLLVVHLREDFLTLTPSGHRRGVRQLHTTELRPPIPPRHSSLLIFPLPLPRSAPTVSSDRTFPPLRIFRCHDSDLTLEVFAAQVGSYQGKCARGNEIFAASTSQTRITDTVVVRERKNLKPSRAKEQARSTSHQNTVSGQRPCGCSLHLNHVQFRFRKHT